MKKSSVIGGLRAGCRAGAVRAPGGAHLPDSRCGTRRNSSYYGDKTGFAIWEGVENREAAASNLMTVARALHRATTPPSPALVGDLEYAVDYSQNCWDGDAGQAEANQLMGQAAQALYEELKNTQLSETDQKYPDQLIAQMESEQDKINRSSYNEDAREFNARLEKFPVNLLRGVAGVEPLATFDYE